MADLFDYSIADVKVTDEYSVNLYEKDVKYLLAIDENRLLAGFYENAGIATKYVRYGGWENSLIGGHTLGHYMTAIAQGYANPLTSEENRRKLSRKIDNILDSLSACQNESKGKTGFIFGAKKISENPEEQFDNVEKNRTNIITQAWVPWYTMHKIISGLISIYNFTHIKKSEEILSALCDWVYNRVKTWNDETRKTVLSVEYGGMNDCLYSAYKITKNPNHLYAAHVFDETELFEKILSGEKDSLDKLHANTTIPKFLGALNRYKTVKDEKYLAYAKAFFDLVKGKHSYITGGVGEWEHFGKDGVLDGERTKYNCETCASYNMLILARELFKITRDKKYADYYETTYTNSILAAMNPETGMAMYFQPMAAGFFKTFSTPFNSFWCCTGTGMEDFTKLGDSVYFSDGECVYVNAFVSSILNAKNIGVKIKQTSTVNIDGKANFSFDSRERRRVALKIRMPDYADLAELFIDGNKTDCDVKDSYIYAVADSDEKVEIRFSFGVKAYPLPDNKNAAAFKYGSAVLAAKLTDERMDEGTTGVEVTVPKRAILGGNSIRISTDEKEKFLKNPDGFFMKQNGEFILKGADKNYTFVPYYSLYGVRYGIYWYIKSSDESAETEVSREIIDVVQPGYGQYENDALHDMKEENSVGCTSKGTYRYAENGGYFEYRMKVEKGRENILILYFAEADDEKSLKITVGEKVIFDGIIETEKGKDLTEKAFLIPEEIVNAAKRINAVGEECEAATIRFSSADNRESAKVREFIYIVHQ